MIVWFIAWSLTTIFLTRMVLLLAGFFKSPILHAFEKYGDEEEFFPLLSPFLAWMGGFTVLTNIVLDYRWHLGLPLFDMGAILLVLAILAHRYPRWFNGQYGLIFNHPRWLAELMRRTTRSERRRIAYMWLRLPPRLRIIYNSNDRAFMEWADMVILSTVWM